MGPPLPSWQREVRVFRHGIPCCSEMLCQIAEKAPKWTFGGKWHDPKRQDEPGPCLGEIPNTKYPRDPCYSFGRAKAERPSSAPPGPRNIPLNPSTPSWGFGTCPRPPPFPGDPGPGPGRLKPGPTGPQYSMQPRRPERLKTPGPGFTRPRCPAKKQGPKWGDPPRPERPRSAGPGHYYYPKTGGGPAYSMQARPPDKEEDWRPLGHQYTYFGYDEFGHTSCANCVDEVPPPPPKKKLDGSRSHSVARARRPASAPAGRAMVLRSSAQ